MSNKENLRVIIAPGKVLQGPEPLRRLFEKRQREEMCDEKAFCPDCNSGGRFGDGLIDCKRCGGSGLVPALDVFG